MHRLILAIGIVLLATAFCRAQGEEAGLVGYWDFDEGLEGGLTWLAHDRSGHGNNGQLDGTVWIPNGKFGGALEFTGDSLVDFGNNPAFNMDTNSFSIEAWVRQDQPAVRDGKIPAVVITGLVFSKWGYTGRIFTGYLLFGMSGGEPTDICFVLDSWSGGTHYKQISNKFPLREWTHMAIVVDRAKNSIFYYQNGECKSTVDCSMVKGRVNSQFPFTIGWARYGGVEYYTKAFLDELAIFKRALTAAEVRRHSQGDQPLSKIFKLNQ